MSQSPESAPWGTSHCLLLLADSTPQITCLVSPELEKQQVGQRAGSDETGHRVHADVELMGEEGWGGRWGWYFP